VSANSYADSGDGTASNPWTAPGGCIEEAYNDVGDNSLIYCPPGYYAATDGACIQGAADVTVWGPSATLRRPDSTDLTAHPDAGATDVYYLLMDFSGCDGITWQMNIDGNSANNTAQSSDGANINLLFYQCDRVTVDPIRNVDATGDLLNFYGDSVNGPWRAEVNGGYYSRPASGQFGCLNPGRCVDVEVSGGRFEGAQKPVEVFAADNAAGNTVKIDNATIIGSGQDFTFHVTSGGSVTLSNCTIKVTDRTRASELVRVYPQSPDPELDFSLLDCTLVGANANALRAESGADSFGSVTVSGGRVDSNNSGAAVAIYDSWKAEVESGVEFVGTTTPNQYIYTDSTEEMSIVGCRFPADAPAANFASAGHIATSNIAPGGWTNPGNAAVVGGDPMPEDLTARSGGYEGERAYHDGTDGANTNCAEPATWTGADWEGEISDTVIN